MNQTDRIVIGGYIVGFIQTNAWFLRRESRQDGILVDPGDHGKELARAMEEKNLKIQAVLLTHGHFDHIGGVQEFVDETHAKVYACEKEKHLLASPGDNLSEGYNRPTICRPDVFVKEGDILNLAGIRLRVIETPGHTEGSCCYYIEDTGEDPFLLAGDTLFRGSVGRTDMPTGSESDIIRSVKNKLFLLPDNTKVFPGHGETTTIGYEKMYNCIV